ncbi:hypothetical protein ACFQ1S_45680, partial [Kibdelosporangium lantanae]
PGQGGRVLAYVALQGEHADDWLSGQGGLPSRYRSLQLRRTWPDVSDRARPAGNHATSFAPA